MTTPPTSEGSRGKRVMGWAAKDRGAEKGQTSTGRKTQGLSFPTIGNDISFFCHCETALTYVDGLPLLGDKVRNGLLLPCWVNRHGPLEVYRASQSSSLGLVG
ncbi:UNVERIFIED_CONTAM: hypothetical protein Sradi_7068600 [Sesamum radiatum]|uniref:Uncharacterized protein n=1 Tax=Sesamum radiatum TaxID=300843 RepID=A0AAW2J5K0_SESRA